MTWLVGYAVFSVFLVAAASWWAWYADIDDARATADIVFGWPFWRQLAAVALATLWCVTLWPILLVWTLATHATPDRADRPDR